MHLLDWVKNLKWIVAIRKYDEVKDHYETILNEYIRQNKSMMNEAVFAKEREYKLEVEINELNAALQAKGSMAKMCDQISLRFNEERARAHSQARNVGNQKMSQLTFHEENLLRIELQTYKDELRHAKGSD